MIAAPALAAPGSDAANIEEAVLQLPVEARARLVAKVVSTLPNEMRRRLAEHDFGPPALGKAQRAERDELLLCMAVGLVGSANALAETVHRDLSRYAASTWRYEQGRDAPRQERHALAHRVLKLNRGKVPSIRSLRRLPWPKQAGEMAKRTVDKATARGDSEPWAR